MKKRLDELLASATAAGDIPGVVATLATKHETLYCNAAGMRELNSNHAMAPDTVVWLASMTKAVTAAAAMQLVEQGRIALDAPAGDYLPALADTQVLEGFDADGQPRLRAPRQAVTLRHLLTHTSGFSYELWNADILQYQQVTGLPSILEASEAALLMPLVFDPGQRWEYGIGLDWAGRVVEAVSGQSLGDYLEHALFQPLGMHSTAFRIGPGMRERLASMHTRGPDGALSVFPFEMPQAPEVQLGGAGLYGTATDYQRFMRMLLNNGELDGERVLQPDTVKLMASNQIGELDVRPMTTAMPQFSNNVDFYPGMRQTSGLSFLINQEDSPQGRPANSLSWAGLSNCYFWIDIKNSLCGAVYSQILPFFDPKVVEFFRAFESTVYTQLE